ncbi:MAG: 30S ribosomal protein S12 methylthiotransferase RimO [Bacteroidales bacterium]
MRVQFVTLGCSKNIVDTEHILAQLSKADIDVVPETEDLVKGNIDVVVLNTCGFIDIAKEESIESIMTALRAKEEGYIKKVFVFGCLSERYMKDLKTSIPEVDQYFGAYDIKNVLKAFGVTYDSSLETHRFITTPRHLAYLKISEGCDRRCSYCAIPGIRGPHISVPIETLVKEATELASKGVKELILIAQDSTYYGLDLYKKRMLGPLITELEKIQGIEWIRIHYSYPDSFPEDVLDIMASSPKVCKYMDIPLQHSEDKVLSAMHRSTSAEQTRAIIKKMREKVPGIVIRTTMMVGHPGEGEREFQGLLDFVKEYKIERLGAFQYSEEEGTWGANNLEDNVPSEVKQSRYDALMELQSSISLAYNNSRIGTEEKVIIDSYSDGIYIARSSKESYEVDGDILIKSNGVYNPLLIGTFADVKIISAGEYDLAAEFK